MEVVNILPQNKSWSAFASSDNLSSPSSNLSLDHKQIKLPLLSINSDSNILQRDGLLFDWVYIHSIWNLSFITKSNSFIPFAIKPLSTFEIKPLSTFAIKIRKGKIIILILHTPSLRFHHRLDRIYHYTPPLRFLKFLLNFFWSVLFRLDIFWVCVKVAASWNLNWWCYLPMSWFALQIAVLFLRFDDFLLLKLYCFFWALALQFLWLTIFDEDELNYFHIKIISSLVSFGEPIPHQLSSLSHVFLAVVSVVQSCYFLVRKDISFWILFQYGCGFALIQ